VKVVFDNNVPVGLARLLTGHTASTSPDLGWTTLRNRVLLANAEAAGFDALVTAEHSSSRLAFNKISYLQMVSGATETRSQEFYRIESTT
jgi:alkanesulfonate monooxygenase SsuD/methylene tetrahydromethanopterin reductase-like flavin-dependent oxidoreductase (luciferase family)